MHNHVDLTINKITRSYLLGFVLSLVFTVLPFFFIIYKIFSSNINYVIILFCAISQIAIHFVFFLHLNFFTSEGRWNIITLLFVIIIIFIIVFGSIWIMFNLNHHMLH